MLRVSPLLILMISILSIAICGAPQIIAQLDQKTQEKVQINQQKTQQLQSLNNEQNNMKLLYSQLVQAKSSAENAYSSYFNQRKKCDGLTVTQDFIGKSASLLEGSCLQAPVDSSALNAYKLRQNLTSIQHNTTLSGILYNQAVIGYDKLAVEYGFYQRSADATYPLMVAAYKKYQDCLAIYASASNPNPSQCQALLEAAQARQAIYGLFRGKQGDFGQMTLRGYGMWRGQLQYWYMLDQNSTANLTQQYKPLIDEVNSAKAQCQISLSSAESLVNSRLSSAATANNNIVAQNTKINQIKTSLDNSLANAKSATSAMATLATQLKQSF